MATRSEGPDLAVDELQRRARRRLAGAIVLALAAAVILPLLLESDPKPLGDDVSIRIPPIDSGKFVNPLSPGKGQGSAAPVAPPAPREADAPTVAAPPTESKPPAARTDAAPASVDATATAGGFVVQLGAFADAKVAADLAATLKGSGFAAYTEALTTAQGAVQRVRVGPFASRDAADTALAKLKAAGYGNAVVTAAK